MKHAFAIVGCGATAIAFLQRHLDRVAERSAPAGTVYLFEKREAFGHGAAYEADLPSNILNTKTAYISPYPHLPGHFLQWLLAYPAAWRPAFAGFEPEADSFAPRALFGLYLKDQVRKLVLRGASLGCQIVLINAEVCAIDLIDGSETVRTRCGVSIATQKVFLFCGPLGGKKDPERCDERVLTTPYPVSRLLETIAPHERVAVIGARLSAIDTVIALIEGGHRGSIRMHSRSGYFPVVRGTQERVELRHLTREGVRALVAQHGPLQISDLVALFRKELAAHDPASSSAVIPLPAPPADIVSFIEHEIQVSQAPRLWQAILYATNGFVEHLWQALDDTAQARFMSEYFSFFMAYRVSIPTENARKILAYLRSGQLEFVSGAFAAPQPVDSQGLILRGAGWEHAYDRLIHATGFPRDAHRLDSALLTSLIGSGAATPHPMGGICVDPDNYCLIGRTGAARQIHAVGELTVGQFFFTSALEINGRHAFCCADAIEWAEHAQRTELTERVEEHV
jgi:uncharacterized NAD(P)/FAD-binding protein YdhS